MPASHPAASTVYAICQPDALGDVIACLPMACAIKRHDPDAKIVFIGREYSRPMIERAVAVDRYLDAEAVLARPALLAEHGVGVFLNPYLPTAFGLAARAAGVPIRVGNLRVKTLGWANRFVVQNTGKVQRHRALLNLRYLRALGIRDEYTLEELGGMVALRAPTPDAATRALLDPARFNLVLHPKSNGSGREWPGAHFERLVGLLPRERVRVFVTGRAHERERLNGECSLLDRAGVVDLCGRLDLDGLIGLLGAVDGFVSSGTGPLHIAAALGTRALGLFPGRDRITAARWHPLGPRGESLSWRTVCPVAAGSCPKNYAGEACACMAGITPEAVAARVLRWLD
ncbi:MAG: glycosyltransferase family 9 protein [Nevskia sp.]